MRDAHYRLLGEPVCQGTNPNKLRVGLLLNSVRTFDELQHSVSLPNTQLYTSFSNNLHWPSMVDLTSSYKRH